MGPGAQGMGSGCLLRSLCQPESPQGAREGWGGGSAQAFENKLPGSNDKELKASGQKPFPDLPNCSLFWPLWFFFYY